MHLLNLLQMSDHLSNKQSIEEHLVLYYWKHLFIKP